MSAPGVTCLIPAWNERARIGNVLAAVKDHPLIARVLVVDDGSTDGTADLVRGLGVDLLQSQSVPGKAGNLGKTGALALGLRAVDTPLVLLLDADLIGIDADAVTRLIAPVQTGAASATISLRGNSPLLWRLIGLDYISGERVLPMALLQPRLEALTRLPRFGFEVFLNRMLIAEGLRVAVVRWPDVASPSKAGKHGLWRGIKGDLGMMRDIFRTIPPLQCLMQIGRLRRLARLRPEGCHAAGVAIGRGRL
ncbi:glycosyltransferase family 2 protein [Gemmobacter serpentinus]|uniref:glycosyltransferase family 2 protein n=1 Tax=Gemmobacter serpentinus TaxID=2652247 RepID=UPI00124E2754|nr:glycosyltransferase [Gemmobacter serpentinus]